MIAFIIFNSSLVPLIEGLWSSNPWEFEYSGWRLNRTDDLGINSPSLWPTKPRLHVRSDQLPPARGVFVHKNSLASCYDLTCKRGSVGQSEGLSLPRSSVRFRPKPDTSNSHEFELHRPSNKGTKLLLKVIKAIIIITVSSQRRSTRSDVSFQTK